MGLFLRRFRHWREATSDADAAGRQEKSVERPLPLGSTLSGSKRALIGTRARNSLKWRFRSPLAPAKEGIGVVNRGPFSSSWDSVLHGSRWSIARES